MSEFNKTLSLTGVTVNAMALIAPGAFLWLTIQVQAAQVDAAGNSTAMDIFPGLVLALILAFLTAFAYSMLSELYPEAGTGSSYYFAERAFLNSSSQISKFARLAKYIVGWFSHLYYWVYPGVMVAMMATMIGYIFGQYGIELSNYILVAIAIIFSFLVGYVAYLGINGSTFASIVINVIQIITLIFVTVLAIIYRLGNPESVTFVHPTFSSIVMPHEFSSVLFQATISILLLVGFESATALAAESKSPKNVKHGVIISLVLQGLIFYLFEYFGTAAWFNSSYGIDKAAASSAPIGDMVKNLGDVLLNGNGFILMIVVAISVAIAVVGTTLACMNTGIRVSYAMAKDQEMPSVLGILHPRNATPHKGVWIITIASAIIGSFGVLSVTNLTAVTFLSNIGTFILYGMTCLITFIAFLRHPHRNSFLHKIVPLLGFIANLGMLLAVLYLGFLGGGDTADAALYSIIAAAVWTVIGVGYLIYNSKSQDKNLILKASQVGK